MLYVKIGVARKSVYYAGASARGCGGGGWVCYMMLQC